MKRLKIFTWHVHGAYLLYLSQIPHDIYIPVGDLGYIGKEGAIANTDNIHEIPIESIHNTDFDCILFQNKHGYLYGWHLLNEKQLKLPSIYLEHDPPREHPTDTKHFVGEDTFVVHVTHYNKLMWDTGNSQTRVIEHGVFIPEEVPLIGAQAKGITVINNLRSRDRRLGRDIFLEARNQVPLDLVGMDAESLGGLGEVPLRDLPALLSQYRYLFHPVRYTSLALAVCEAMAVGLPIVGLATTELPRFIKNGVSGYLSNDINELIPIMRELNQDLELVHKLGQGSRRVAQRWFSLDRFIYEWNDVLNTVTG
jgi:glycosyltransferase involved in cell wall biosynthesis